MQRVRQQDSFAARSNVTQFRHRVVRLGGANNVFKVEKYCFRQKKGDAIVPPLLCMNQEYISALKSEWLPLFW